MRSRDLNLFDVVHDGRHQWPVEFDSKNCASLADARFSNTLLTKVGDGGNSDVVHEVVAEVVTDALDSEGAQDGEGDHGPDVVDSRPSTLTLSQFVRVGSPLPPAGASRVL